MPCGTAACLEIFIDRGHGGKHKAGTEQVVNPTAAPQRHRYDALFLLPIRKIASVRKHVQILRRSRRGVGRSAAVDMGGGTDRTFDHQMLSFSA